MTHPTLIKPLILFLMLVCVLAGDSFGQRRGWGGGSTQVYRPTPPRPMTPAYRPMTQANTTMAPRVMTPQPMAPRLQPPANSNLRGPSGPSGSAAQPGRVLPFRLANAPVAQMPSYSGRVTVRGTPIVMTKTGATFSIPEKGVFSTKTVQRFQFVRNTLVRHSADGKVAFLQSRITKYASAPQLVTTRIAANDNGKGNGSGSGSRPPAGGGGGGDRSASGSGGSGGDGKRVAANDNLRPSKESAVLSGAVKAVIDPRKLTDYALNPSHPTGKNKAKVFESAFGFTNKNSDDLMKQIREGVMNNPAVAGKTDRFGKRFTVDIPVTGPTGNGIVRSGWIYKTGSDIPELTTLFVK